MATKLAQDGNSEFEDLYEETSEAEEELNEERQQNPFLCGKPGWDKLKPDPKAESDRESDEKVTSYKILDVIGVGGFGITYLAEEEDSGEKVAIKECFPDMFAVRDMGAKKVKPRRNKKMFERACRYFKAEAKALEKFGNQRSIVNIRSSFSAWDTEYIVMEFVNGPSLSKVIQFRHSKGKGFSEKDLRSVFEPIAQALKHIHTSDPDVPCFHLDIKPSNILLKPKSPADAENKLLPLTAYEPVLIDFGSARHDIGRADKSGKTQTYLNTKALGYSPFEQIQPTGVVGAYSDIYSLAATVYCALSGAPPEDATTRLDQKIILSGLFEGNDSNGFFKAIEKGLESRQVNRPQSVAEWIKMIKMDSSSAIGAKTEILFGPIPGPTTDREGGESENQNNRATTATTKSPSGNDSADDKDGLTGAIAPSKKQKMGDVDKVDEGKVPEGGKPFPYRIAIACIIFFGIGYLGYDQLGTNGPGNGGSDNIEPKVVKPKVVKPKVVKPKVVKPEVVKPEVVKPEVVKSEATREFNLATTNANAATSEAEKVKVWGNLLIRWPDKSKLTDAEDSLIDTAKNSFNSAIKEVYEDQVRSDSNPNRDSQAKSEGWSSFTKDFRAFQDVTTEAGNSLEKAGKNQSKYASISDLNQKFDKAFDAVSMPPDSKGVTVATLQKTWKPFYYKFKDDEKRLEGENKSNWERVAGLIARDPTPPPPPGPDVSELKKFVKNFLESGAVFPAESHLSYFTEEVVLNGVKKTRESVYLAAEDFRGAWSEGIEIEPSNDFTPKNTGSDEWEAVVPCKVAFKGRYNQGLNGDAVPYTIGMAIENGKIRVNRLERLARKSSLPTDSEYLKMMNLLQSWVETNNEGANSEGATEKQAVTEKRLDLYRFPIERYYDYTSMTSEDLIEDLGDYSSHRNWDATEVSMQKISERHFTIRFTAPFYRTRAQYGRPRGMDKKSIKLDLEKDYRGMKIHSETNQ